MPQDFGFSIFQILYCAIPSLEGFSPSLILLPAQFPFASALHPGLSLLLNEVSFTLLHLSGHHLTQNFLQFPVLPSYPTPVAQRELSLGVPTQKLGAIPISCSVRGKQEQTGAAQPLPEGLRGVAAGF